MKIAKKLFSFRFSENFIRALGELAIHAQREEGNTFPWAGSWTRTKTIQWAVRRALKEFSTDGIPVKKKPARKKAKAANR